MSTFDSRSRKVALDMSVMQSTWALWFIAIVTLIYFVSPMFGIEMRAGNQLGELVTRILTGNWEDGEVASRGIGFVTFIAHPSKIFMLVLGIISIYGFLTSYVKQGVTRKAYYSGATVSAVVLSLMFAFISGLILLLEMLIYGTWSILEISWIASLLAYGLNIWFYYAAGMLIGIGFYRYGAGGLFFIVLAVAFAFALEALWGPTIIDWFNMSILFSYASTLLLVIIVLWVVKMLTRRVRIRLK